MERREGGFTGPTAAPTTSRKTGPGDFLHPSNVLHQDVVYAKGNPIQVAEATRCAPTGGPESSATARTSSSKSAVATTLPIVNPPRPCSTPNAAAVDEVDREPDRHPHHEAPPRDGGQAEREPQASEDGDRRQTPDERMRNLRCASGRFTASTITPAHTGSRTRTAMPMLVSSTTSSMLPSAAGTATINPGEDRGVARRL